MQPAHRGQLRPVAGRPAALRLVRLAVGRHVEFVKDVRTKERFPPGQEIGVRIGRKALENGLLSRFDPHWLAFGPALIVTAEQLDEMIAILDRSMGEVLGS